MLVKFVMSSAQILGSSAAMGTVHATSVMHASQASAGDAEMDWSQGPEHQQELGM